MAALCDPVGNGNARSDEHSRADDSAVAAKPDPGGKPPRDLLLSATSVAENLPPGTTVGTLSAIGSSPKSTFTYALVTGAGSADNASFSVAGDLLRTAATFNAEVRASYSIRLRVTSSPGSKTREEIFTITVTSVNEAPTDLALSPSVVAENQPANTVVGTLDRPTPTPATRRRSPWSPARRSTDNASFNISGGSCAPARPSTSRPSPATRSASAAPTPAASSSRSSSPSPSPNVERGADRHRPRPAVGGREPARRDDRRHALRRRIRTPATPSPSPWSPAPATPTTPRSRSPATAADRRGPSTSRRSASYSIRVRITDATAAALREAAHDHRHQRQRGADGHRASPSTVAENQAVGHGRRARFGHRPRRRRHRTRSPWSTGTGDTDNASFNIVGRPAEDQRSFDFETKSSYSIRVRATDAGGLYFEKQLTDHGHQRQRGADRHRAVAVARWPRTSRRPPRSGALSATDPDAGDTHTFTLVAGTGATDNAVVQRSPARRCGPARCSTSRPKTSYSVRVRATDARRPLLREAVHDHGHQRQRGARPNIALSHVVGGREPAGRHDRRHALRDRPGRR